MIDKETNSPNVLLTRFALPFFTIYGKTIVTAKAGRKCSDSEFVPRFLAITKIPVVSQEGGSILQKREQNKRSERKMHCGLPAFTQKL